MTAIALAGCPGPDETPLPAGAGAPAASNLPHTWPPARGKPYPDLELPDLSGKPVKLSSFKGKVLLVQPVGLPSPGSVAFTGGRGCAPFRGVAPDPLDSVEMRLESVGVDIEHPDLVTIQVLFYGSMTAAPSIEDARAWVGHFGLDRRKNSVVLVGDGRYIGPATFAMIPGFQLVDRDFVLRAEAGHAGAPDDATIFPLLRDLLLPLPPELPDPFPPPPERFPGGDLYALLAAGKRAELEAELARVRARGRGEGDFETHLSGAYDDLTEFPGVLEHLDAWCKASPDSALAFLVRGTFLIHHAWRARGGGWASTVSEAGWRLFRERLLAAKADLERAAKLDPTLPHAAAELVTVAMGLNLGDDDVRRFFELSQKADPRFFDTYSRLLLLLHPKWSGSPEAMLGFAYESVKQVPDEPAMRFLVADAHLQLAPDTKEGNAYLRRPEVRKDIDEAFERVLAAYPRSASVACKRSEYARRTGDALGEVKWLRKAAKLGHRGAMRAYGLAFQLGQNGLSMDQTRAYLWYRRAAEAGFVVAQGDVGSFLVYGRQGFEARPEAGVAWLRLAMDRGSAFAVCLLGLQLWDGRGVKKDLGQAAACFRKAAAAGDANSGAYLKKLLEANPALRRAGDP